MDVLNQIIENQEALIAFIIALGAVIGAAAKLIKTLLNLIDDFTDAVERGDGYAGGVKAIIKEKDEIRKAGIQARVLKRSITKAMEKAERLEGK